MPIRDEEVVEGRWQCRTCGFMNRGRVMRCGEGLEEGCGMQIPEDVRYLPPEEMDSAPAVSDPGMLGDALAGANWACDYCEKQNRNNNTGACGFCGCPRGTGGRKRKAPPAVPAVRGRAEEERAAAWRHRGDPRREVWVGRVRIGGGVAAVVAVLVLLAWALSPRHLEARVARLDWRHAVDVRAKTAVAHEGWGSPPGAFEVSCETRQRGTRRVIDHYRQVTRYREVCRTEGRRVRHDGTRAVAVQRDLENGYFTRERRSAGGGSSYSPRGSGRSSDAHDAVPRRRVCDQVPYADDEPVYRTEPVYDRWCRYREWEWPVVRRKDRLGRIQAAGAGAQTQWPTDEEVALRPPDEREERAATYTVTLRAQDGEEFVYSPRAEEEFLAFRVGQAYGLRVGIVDGVAIEHGP